MKFNIKFLNTAYLNFKKKISKIFIKNRVKNDLPKNLIEIKSINEFENYIKKISHKDYLLILQRGASLDKKNFFDLELFKKYKVKTITVDNMDPWVQSNFKNNFFMGLLRTFHKSLRYYLKKKISFKKLCTFLYTWLRRNFKKTFYSKKHKNTKYIDCSSLSINFTLNNKNKNIITYVDENIFFSRDDLIGQTDYKKIKDIDMYLAKLKNFLIILKKNINLKLL